MLVAKLNTGQIVLVIKTGMLVKFSNYRHVLINDNLNARPERYKPYWTIETNIAWMMEIKNEPRPD